MQHANSHQDAGHPQVKRVLARSLIVLTGYLVYVAVVFAVPGPDQPDRIQAAALGVPDGSVSRDQFDAGRSAWLRAGCQNCHSLYGLGGHSGPDLTNVSGRVPEPYIRHMIRFGNGGMPPAGCEEGQTAAILVYLRAVNATGVYPPRSARAPVFGERP